EGDRLADQAEREIGARRLSRLVAEDDQAWAVRARTADGSERAHPQLVDLLRVECLDAQAREVELGGARGEPFRGEPRGGRTREVARPVDPACDTGRAGADPLGPCLIARAPTGPP